MISRLFVTRHQNINSSSAFGLWQNICKTNDSDSSKHTEWTRSLEWLQTLRRHSHSREKGHTSLMFLCWCVFFMILRHDLLLNEIHIWILLTWWLCVTRTHVVFLPLSALTTLWNMEDCLRNDDWETRGCKFNRCMRIKAPFCLLPSASRSCWTVTKLYHSREFKKWLPAPLFASFWWWTVVPKTFFVA